MILASPTANRPLTALLARISAALPRGWAGLSRQLAIFAAFDLAYELSRILASSDRGIAMAHGNDIVSAERSLP